MIGMLVYKQLMGYYMKDLCTAEEAEQAAINLLSNRRRWLVFLFQRVPELIFEEFPKRTLQILGKYEI